MVNDPEPTDLYYALHKVGCVIYVIFVFVMYIVGAAEFITLRFSV